MRAPASRLRLLLAAVVGVVPAYACQLVFPTVAEQPPDASDAGSDSALRLDVQVDVATGPYKDFTDKANWESFDFSDNLKTYTFGGGAFDGRYVYLAPWGGVAGRYDTHAPFTSATSWEDFDTRTIGEAGANGALYFFFGAVFDGRYVYYVPQNNGTPNVDLVVARFDTTAQHFNDATAWLSFDATTAFGSKVQAFTGATFDGRYIYLVPALNGTALQYDTTASFETASSWVPFDMTTVKGGASGLLGAVFDGRYVYFVPYENQASYDVEAGGGISGTQDGIVMRYDTKAPFGLGTSWTSFDTTRLEGSNTQGFSGGAFDGHHVYLCPFDGLTGVIPRVDVDDGGFLDAHAWATLTGNSVSPKANGFWGGAYDGRYVYMVPFSDTNGAQDGLAIRYDTTETFTDAGSWTKYDIQAQFGVSAVGFAGAVFDGEYLYYLPAYYTTVVRFHVRSPPATPNLPYFHGSFL